MIAILSVLAALVLCYLLARERFGRATSALAALGVFAGSSVAWYLDGAAEQSGPVRLLLGSAAAYGWVRASRGLSGSAVWWRAGAGVAVGIAATLPWLAGTVAGIFSFDGTLGAGNFSLTDVLWSSRGGLLASSPAIYFGVIGLVVLWRSDRVLSTVGLSLVGLTAFIVAAHARWWLWAWPSAPAFLALAPYFVCGLAALVEASARVVARRPLLATGALASILVLWNVTAVKVAQDGNVHLGEPVSFADLGAAQALALHGWIGHPPSAPASLLYAAANGVRPGAYDLLGPDRLLAGGAASGRLDIGTGDGPFVGAGWHVAEQDGGTSFRWAMRSAFVDVPLDHPANLVVEVPARPYQPPKAPPQQLTLVVNGVAQPAVTLAPGWHPATVPVPAAAWRSGVNHLELRFAYDARPSDAGIPDGRSLAASIDAIVVRVAP
ncbi:MAG: hypothetical protein ABIT71_02260 [Vicinamibacteraceae bacterium]